MKLDKTKVSIAKLGPGGKATGVMSDADCTKVIQAVKNELKFNNDEEAMACITGLCQSGGTNRNAGTQVQFTYDGKTLIAKRFQDICRTEGNGTARQFARNLNNDIQEYASFLNIEGDLAKQMRLQEPNLSPDDAIWCANYQTLNPRCPQNVRNWLKSNYESRFP